MFTNTFEGRLNNKKIEDFTSRLDYTIESLDERLELVKKILEGENGKLDGYFVEFFDQDKQKPHFKANVNKTDSLSEDCHVTKQIQHIANYLLFCKEALQENDYSEYPYLDNAGKLSIKKRELSLEQLEDEKTQDGTSKLDYLLKENEVGTKQYLPFKVEKKDIKEIEEIRNIQEQIDHIKNEILPNLENNSSIRSYIGIMKDLKYQQVMIKRSIKRPIEFKKLSRSEVGYTFELSEVDDYNGLIVHKDAQAIHLGSVEHVSKILNLYSELKMSCFDKLNSDIKYILSILEDTIDAADLKEYERDVLIMKIDGLKAKEILEEINSKYGLEWNEDYLSKLWKRVIPKKITDRYLEDCLDYIYTYLKKGKYKTCSKCGEVKLMSNRYFSLNKDSVDGFHSTCKKCRNEKREEIE